jgi:crotonobetainyl-CoA:carnitine CoA-transferase CaiB-like acyl-CoA transferase
MVQIAVGSENLWKKFAPAFGLPVDGAGFATNADRVGNGPAVRAAIDEAFGRWTAADLVAELAELGIPSGQVKNLAQVYQWDQTESQGLVVDVDHPTLGTIRLPGPPLRFFDGTDGERVLDHAAPPLLGQHTDEVLSWLAEATPARLPERSD